ncbi:hypothetical protein K502DRAFT_336854 [Neoconidiobolus thromboides FSU 785]|nr:hypothetical protein K502DRAFT_336854 [Neoconidiobolus thromboides FSU 785]
MGKLTKKNKSGNATMYITRNRAIKKLQITLNDFRRLCIIKGIHPVEPKNKKKANFGMTGNKTFYFSKDIQFLSYEPLIQTLRDKKIFARKLAKAQAKKQPSIVKSLNDHRPEFVLDHVIRERYPTFIDALRDLDDALSMLFLFSTMPPADRVSNKVVSECQRLTREFLHYVIYTKSLRKTFLSIKGVYYQVEIHGQEITWLVPYQFSQKVPKFVDFKVMLQFLEVYTTLLNFVNFKLYNELNFTYPPVIDTKLENEANYLKAIQIDANESIEKQDVKKEVKPINKAMESRLETLNEKIQTLTTKEDDTEATNENPADKEEDIDNFQTTLEADDEDSNQVLKALNDRNQMSSFQALFANQKFYLSREVPKNSLEFVIESFGGQVGWDSTIAGGSPYKEDNPKITYQVTDRPVIPNRRTDRIYVQPQWIYDCINSKKLINESAYAPGKELPSHLSPFVTYKEGDYVPEEAYQFDEEEKEKEINMSDVEGASEARDEEEEEEEEEEEKIKEEAEEEEKEEDIKKEAKGVTYSKDVNAKSKKRKNVKLEAIEKEEEDKKEMSKMMMSKKQKNLYTRLTRSNSRKNQETIKLEEKKKAVKGKK